MSVTIEESGLSFGKYAEGDVFHAEKSDLYQKLGDSVKSVEFILRKDSHTLLWVEAKSSSPDPNNPQSRDAFDSFLSEICEKFEHSLSFYMSAILKRIPDQQNEISKLLREVDYAAASLKLILVINGHREIWLRPVADGLKRKLRACAKIWRINPIHDIAVINEDGAKIYKLTAAESQKG
jgi:hypothetical protein